MSRNKKMSFLEILLVAIAVTVLLWSPAWAAETIEVLRNPRYTMGAGDTLPSVARKFGVKGGADNILDFQKNIGAIRLSTNGRFAFPQPGDKFYIPGLYKKVAVSTAMIKRDDMVVIPWSRVVGYRQNIANLTAALGSAKNLGVAKSVEMAILKKKAGELHSQAALAFAEVESLKGELAKNATKGETVIKAAKSEIEEQQIWDFPPLVFGLFTLAVLILLGMYHRRDSSKQGGFQAATPETVIAVPENDSAAKIRQIMAEIEKRRQAEALVAAAMEMTGEQLEKAFNTPVIVSADKRFGDTLLKNVLKPLSDPTVRDALLRLRLADMPPVIDAVRASCCAKRATTPVEEGS